MTEERKHAILLATVILTARKLQPLLQEDDAAGKPNMGREFWAETYTKKSMERAAHILDLIDEKWPGRPDSADETPISSGTKLRPAQISRTPGQPFSVSTLLSRHPPKSQRAARRQTLSLQQWIEVLSVRHKHPFCGRIG